MSTDRPAQPVRLVNDGEGCFTVIIALVLWLILIQSCGQSATLDKIERNTRPAATAPTPEAAHEP